MLTCRFAKLSLGLTYLRPVFVAAAAAFVLAGTSNANAVSPAKCVRDAVLTTFRMYACRYFVNEHALDGHSLGASIDITVFDCPNGELCSQRRFGKDTPGNQAVCGTVRFAIRNESVDGVEEAHARASLALAQTLNDSYNYADVEIEKVADVVAPKFVSRSKIGASTHPVAIPEGLPMELTVEITRLNTAVLNGFADIESKQPVKFGPDRCTVNSGAFTISLPQTIGPDLAALSKQGEASDDYTKFSAWLDRVSSQIGGENR